MVPHELHDEHTLTTAACTGITIVNDHNTNPVTTESSRNEAAKYVAYG